MHYGCSHTSRSLRHCVCSLSRRFVPRSSTISLAALPSVPVQAAALYARSRARAHLCPNVRRVRSLRRRNAMIETTATTLSRTAMERGWILAVSVIAIGLGVIAIVIPGPTLVTVAIVFGIHLIAVGVFRLLLASTASRLEARVRWLTGLLGVLILTAGILCLSNPFESLSILGLVIGGGWILDGLSSIASGRTVAGPVWWPIVAGITSIVAGVLTVIMPVLALASFVTVVAVLLIVVGVSGLLLLPVRVK
ncbi:hypothetical protein C5C66_03315 [Rathayibacter toxicus]|uniref:DUF308 domain-containing protein n=2 Tax=Rathayibacter toxicus TaxID=145458 RepID=A0A2S5Y941_9MICO|nr:hypothetical protein C5D15_03290 [Rathayibacter toxicus]PPG47857.1 hypothetical protein C5D16_03280 [Rathayibacter toxicus]PPH25001.1 hypothetical protein C5D17_03265 [Rathayibacter toxicus]PPH58927.1 hypothetical protein C5D30_03285 [Rathayibacter toxicus]PPH60921.1 hypothetical protein C5C93_03315 [Rathayibacter toxicus]